MSKDAHKLSKIIEKLYIGILIIIFGGIVLHAPISVFLGSVFPDYELLIKSWKEILMVVAGIIALILMYRNKRFNLLKDPLIVAIICYGALHIVMIIFLPQSLLSTFAGLMIDLRYLLFFILVYLALKMYPKYYNIFIKIGIAGALVVLIFALLQVFVLPNDILKYIGYDVSTISPYLTVDQNQSYVRINSTLRGPNPLGAYAGIVLAFLVSAAVKHKVGNKKQAWAIFGVLLIGGCVALWASYSRSALIGTIASLVIVLAIALARKISKKTWIIIGTVILMLSCGLWMIKDTAFVSNVVFHTNPTDNNRIDSNEGHMSSLKNGFKLLISQPFGVGVGSTGSASLYGNSPMGVENQYLFTAHETGWLGLGLFVYIFGYILYKLWLEKKDWVALGLFASGIGLAIIGCFLPVLTDDTVSIIWWGMAAIALAYSHKDYN